MRGKNFVFQQQRILGMRLLKYIKAPVVPCCSPLLAMMLLMFIHRLLLSSLCVGYLFCGVIHSVVFSYNHLLEQERSGYFASLCFCFPVAVIVLFLAVCGLVYNF